MLDWEIIPQKYKSSIDISHYIVLNKKQSRLPALSPLSIILSSPISHDYIKCCVVSETNFSPPYEKMLCSIVCDVISENWKFYVSEALHVKNNAQNYLLSNDFLSRSSKSLRLF